MIGESAILTDSQLESFFTVAKANIERDFMEAAVIWAEKAISEINMAVAHSLEGKFRACTEAGYNAAKIGGVYAFWIAKLKPVFAYLPRDFAINEYIALHAGISFVRERLDLQISLEGKEMWDFCDTLRFHTSSPHTMVHIFALWIERAKLRKENIDLKAKCAKLGARQ